MLDYQKELNNIGTVFNTTVKKLQNEIAVLKEGLTGKILMFHKIKDCPKIYHYKGKKKGYEYYSPACTPNDFLNDLKNWYNTHEEKVKENEDIKKNNVKIYEKLIKLFKDIGLDEMEYDKKSRKTFPPRVLAEWVKSLQSAIPMNCISLEKFREEYNQSQKQIYDWENEIKKVEEDRIKQEEKEKQEKLKNLEFAKLLNKYEMDVGCTEDELLDKILKSNKYLRLAYYLEENRNDWNDGYSYAECGLRNFKIDNEQDQKIFDCISKLIEDWDGDGRCFRDCEWNYDVIYSLVENDQLLKDLEKAKEFCRNY